MLPLFLKKSLGLFAVLAFATAPALSPAFAQVENVDPNDVIDADLAAPDYDGNFEPAAPNPNMVEDAPIDSDINADIVTPADTTGATENGLATSTLADDTTYQDDDLIGAAEGVFGKGAKGLAQVIEDILKKQGRPNAYITGREASGAFVVGLRYGSGKLYHKVEGERPVYWTGPSIGFDFGGNAANSFVLVYNLYDSEELFQRFPAGEGAAYFIGGFHVSYLRSGDKVLIPVRLGAGLRLGANVGYMKFSKKQKWLPF
ncbi:DUF1134 domain-containing protein [Parasphingorhabdus sp.]|uniref:DUF1134 domain-containing protein n=1 Tax=Parasphingorhabdus sp. TaxID=2709688 RepID=UPI0032657306